MRYLISLELEFVGFFNRMDAVYYDVIYYEELSPAQFISVQLKAKR